MTKKEDIEIVALSGNMDNEEMEQIRVEIAEEMSNLSKNDHDLLVILSKIASELFGGHASLAPLVMNLAILSAKYPELWNDFTRLTMQVTPPRMAQQTDGMCTTFEQLMGFLFEYLEDTYPKDENDEDSS